MTHCKIKIDPKKFTPYSQRNLHRIEPLKRLSEDEMLNIKAAAAVFPFRVNNYVIEELIDWNRIPEDPIYQMTFPQPGMLEPGNLARMKNLLRKKAPKAAVLNAAREIQAGLNPHPAGQMKLNVPSLHGKRLTGMQHKYDETVLFFPSQGQTCHAYCTYCFRWAQFVGVDSLRFASSEIEPLANYLEAHPEVTDVLFTGGDPLTMSARLLESYVNPLLKARPGGLKTIRFGTKSLAYWPYRFVTDRDADDLMRILERIVRSGFHLAVMAHFSHFRELETPAVGVALQRLRSAGAVIRCQAPLIRHVNDDSQIWARMWETEVRLGAVPYYMFVERDTGPKNYFGVPLVRAHEIYTEAFRRVSGLCRTVRGPSMSATPGKVLVDVARIQGKKVLALKFVQGRDSRWVNRIFFAAYDEKAEWLDELRPAFGQEKFFFEILPDKRFRTPLPLRNLPGLMVLKRPDRSVDRGMDQDAAVS